MKVVVFILCVLVVAVAADKPQSYNDKEYKPSHRPRPAYRARAPKEPKPEPEYKAPVKPKEPELTYKETEPIYKKPELTYKASEPIYKEPELTYKAPEPIYKEPKLSYKEPEPMYKEPEQTYKEPEPSYKGPEPEPTKYEEPMLDEKHYVEDSAEPTEQSYGEASYTYRGMYSNETGCGNDGLYYRDESSFVFCSNGNKYDQPCAPGTKNSEYLEYTEGEGVSYRDFCNVNLVDMGYVVDNYNPTEYHEEPRFYNYRRRSFHGDYYSRPPRGYYRTRPYEDGPYADAPYDGPYGGPYPYDGPYDGPYRGPYNGPYGYPY